ncbi:MAG: PAS domain-containing sensor histidine kinase [Actinomycetota bacterium]
MTEGGPERGRSLVWTESAAQAVLEAMADLVFVKDAGSGFIWGNAAFRSVYGMTEDEIGALSFDGEHVALDDTLQYVGDDQLVFSGGQTVDVGVEPITASTGEVAYFHTVKSPLRGGDGEVIGLVGVARPATAADAEAVDELAAARQVRQTSLGALRALVASLPPAVAMFDASQRLIAWSDAFATLLGEPPDAELFGRRQQDSFEAIVPIGEHLRATQLDGGRRRETIEVGERRLAVEIRAWRTGDGRVGGTLAAMYDVTELLRVQDRLRAANDELVQFNHRASHDLVAPLSAVSGTLQLVDEMIADGDTDDLAMLIGMARTEVDRLRGLVTDLIELARSDASVGEAEPVDLAAIAREVVATHTEALQDAGVEAVVDVVTGPVRSVDVRLRQTLDNLVSNALKYIDPAEAEPTISVAGRSVGDAVEIEVSDNGTGVDVGLRDGLFDLFVRGGSPDSGHGLGLYIVKQHVERLGGHVRLSSPAKPTTFSIALPAVAPGALI